MSKTSEHFSQELGPDGQPAVKDGELILVLPQYLDWWTKYDGDQPLHGLAVAPGTEDYRLLKAGKEPTPKTQQRLVKMLAEMHVWPRPH